VSVSWFRSLLAAIEAQDTNGVRDFISQRELYSNTLSLLQNIEIMTYVTQPMKSEDLAVSLAI